MKRKTLIIAILACALICIFAFTCCSNQNNSNRSAYEKAVENGYVGTLQQWINDISGIEDGSSDNGSIDRSTEIQKLLESDDSILEGESTPREETDVFLAVNNAVLSVVSVKSTFTKTIYNYNRWGQRLNSEESEYSSAGSGVIVYDEKQEGNAYVVTNYHVVFDNTADNVISQDIMVFLYGMELDKYGINVRYLGGSMTYDIAVLVIEQSQIYKESNAKAAKIGSSDDMAIGETVVAIGNPKAEGISATSGIISKESEFISMTGADNITPLTFRVMRIDAAVNGGNSGGGLFNSKGELIGIVNAKIVADEIEGIAYAIPIDLACSAAANIICNCNGIDTSIQRCLIGVSVQVDDSKTVIDQNGKIRIVQTIKITSVEKDSVAEKSGIAVDDIIKSVEYDGKLISIDRSYHLTDYSLRFKKGDSIVLNLIRNGQELAVTVVLSDPIVVA